MAIPDDQNPYRSPAHPPEPVIDIPRGKDLTLPLYLHKVAKFLQPTARCSEYFDQGLVAEGHELLDHARRNSDRGALALLLKKEVGDILFFVLLQPDVLGRPPLIGCAPLHNWYCEPSKNPRFALPPADYHEALSALEIQLGNYASLCAKLVREPNVGSRIQARNQVLHNILLQLTVVGNYWGFTLRDAAETNLEKLTSRSARGVITGDGDSR